VEQMLTTLYHENWTHGEEEKLVETALDLALAIDSPELCKKMVEKFLGIKQKVSYKVCRVVGIPSECVLTKVLALVNKYTWPVLQTTMLQLMDMADSSQIGNFVRLYSSIASPEMSVCERVIKRLADDKPQSTLSFRRHSSSLSSDLLIPVLDFILQFPRIPIDMAVLGKQLANLPCMSSLELCADLATHLTNNKAGLPVLAALEERFLSQASKEANLSDHTGAVCRQMKVTMKLGRQTSMQSLTSLVLAQPDHQKMLSRMLGKVTAGPIPKADALLTLMRARVVHLQAEVARGPPPFTWRLSQAAMTAHPKVERFLRGDQQRFSYSSFTGIQQARKWADKQNSSMGTLATFTPGGIGARAFVQIVKRMEGFNQVDTKAYNSKLVELNRLIACLPPSSVPQIVMPSTNTTSSSSSSETIDLTRV